MSSRTLDHRQTERRSPTKARPLGRHALDRLRAKGTATQLKECSRGGTISKTELSLSRCEGIP